MPNTVPSSTGRIRLPLGPLFTILLSAFKGRRLLSVSLAIILGTVLASSGLFTLFTLRVVQADNTAQTPPFSQDWTNIGLITGDDDWSAVPGIVGFRGDGLAGGTGVNPQTVVTESNVVDVNADEANPNTFATGGVSEFHIANPVVALQGSGTARAPYIQFHLNTSGFSSINVAYNLRDIDGSADNAVQPVALQFRVGSSGNFTNVPAGFVADATTGPTLATLVTPVSVTLPAAADNQPVIQVRVITTDAVGSDEWVGIDDIVVTGSGVGTPTNPSGIGQATPDPLVAGNATLLTVTVTPGANPTSTGLAVTTDLSTIGGSPTQTFFDDGSNGDVTPGNNVFSFNFTVPVSTTPGAKTLPFTITDTELRSGTGSISLTIQSAPPPADHLVISQIYGGGGNAGAFFQNDYVELFNPSTTTFNVNGWSVQYSSATGSGWASGTVPLAGAIAPGQYYLVKLGSNGAVGFALIPANVEGTTVNMSATNGKIALVNDSAGLTGSTPTCPTDDVNLIDLVGYGSTANCREGSANAPGPSGGTVNSTAILRNANGASDTNQNGDDFALGTPFPRRTAPIVDAPPSVSSTDTDSDPFDGTPAPRDGSVAVFFSEPVEVTGTWYDLTCANTGFHTTVVAAGPRNWIITPDNDFQPGEQCTFQIFAANVRDTDTDDSQPNTDFMLANFSTNFTVATGAAAPYDPSVHLTMGNPSGAVADTGQPNNYLLEKPELALSYNRDRGGPNWVSWHLSNDWTGSLTRVDTFRPDPRLPAEWNRVNQFDYTASGFDRGHMTPSADRLATLPMNQATFLMDNIIPQAPDNNQATWNNMEQALRTLTPANELYIVSGGAGTGGSGDNGFATTIAGGRIAVPAFTWKVALVIPKGDNDISRVTCSSQTIAVIVPNTNATNPDWTAYLTTINAVEALTGYDFFSNLPDAVENCLEGAVLEGAGATLVNESCPAFNSAVDPGERVTVNLSLTNTGTASTSNLVATLQSTGGVVAPSGPQNYGAIAPGNNAAKAFSFTATGTCGGTITATLHLQDGATDLGTVTYSFTLGVDTSGGFVCTTPCGGVRLVVTSQVTRSDESTVQAAVTVQNIGSETANNVMVTTAKLGSTNGTPLPQGLGNLAPGATVNAVVNFANSTPGATVVLNVGGTYTGGTFSTSKRVTVP